MSGSNKPEAKRTRKVPTFTPELNLPLVNDIISWCMVHGAVMAQKKQEGSDEYLFSHVPVAVAPTAFPRQAFEDALELGPLFHKLVEGIAQDPDWLLASLADAGKGDDFTQRYMDLLQEVRKEGIQQPVSLGIFRSDYMVDHASSRLLQVELNTGSVAFPGISSRLAKMHKFLAQTHPTAYPLGPPQPNNADIEIADALALAHKTYERNHLRLTDAKYKLKVLVVVQDGERNVADQRILEYALFERHNLACTRLSLGQIFRDVKIEGGRLIGPDWEEYSFAYFRAGYTPTDFPGEEQWKARHLIESSLAIKCPTVAYNLAGAKKIQQKLMEPGQVERFIKNQVESQKLRACFAGLWSLAKRDRDEQVVARAIADPDRFVVKPQREGGGNNFYKQDVVKALTTMSEDELGAHILMEMIFPEKQMNALMKTGIAQTGETLCELGIYSVYLSDGSLNKAAGYLLRQKFDSVQEGGVASGFACLSSPVLTDNSR